MNLLVCFAWFHSSFLFYLRFVPFWSILSFLVAFREIVILRKATVSFLISARPSVCMSVHMEQLISHWTNFDEI